MRKARASELHTMRKAIMRAQARVNVIAERLAITIDENEEHLNSEYTDIRALEGALIEVLEHFSHLWGTK